MITFAVRDFNPHETVAALYGIGKVVVRVCNDKRIRACFHIYNDESDVDRTLSAVERIARNGIPSGTPSALEWTAKMMDGED